MSAGAEYGEKVHAHQKAEKEADLPSFRVFGLSQPHRLPKLMNLLGKKAT